MASTKPKDGIIKYDLTYTPSDPLPEETIAEVNRYRQLMHEMGLIGQNPDRYGGYGYGNISQRIGPFYPAARHYRRFAISGTQTGHLDVLGPQHYAIVDFCVPHRNILKASGPIKPSSESLTHGVLYDLDAQIHAVIHVHSPEIWHAAERLDLPTTDPDVSYGSPEMASEVERLYAETDLRTRRVLSMGGHEDGIIAYGRTPGGAATSLLKLLKQARA